jgi:hypothetical protein
MRNSISKTKEGRFHGRRGSRRPYASNMLLQLAYHYYFPQLACRLSSRLFQEDETVK